MNRRQKYEDHALKHPQYLLSATFHPLDILTYEMFTHENGNPNLERYSTMLRDIRRLLLHVCSTMTQQHNNLALRAIDPSFHLDNDTKVNYTLPLDEFQQIIDQQTAARKAIRDATVNRKQRRFKRNSSNSGSSSNGSDPSFFRSSPPSQQDSFSNKSPPHLIQQPLSSSTMSSWLHCEFIARWISEPNVSIRSLASSRALDLEVSKDNIVTLGNWASSSAFEHHYQRNQMAHIDFTSTVLSDPLGQFSDAPEDFFSESA